MRGTRFGLGLAAALLAAGGCGEGRVIFNVDVYSFLRGTGQDTIPYAVPPLTPNLAVSNVPERFRLLQGAGNSVVDSVRFTGTANFVNQLGSGTIAFQLYIAADSAGTYSPAGLAINLPPSSVSGTNTTPVTIAADLSGSLKLLFTEPELWVRMVAAGSNPGVTPVVGKMVLTSLQLRIVLQDKLF